MEDIKIEVKAIALKLLGLFNKGGKKYKKTIPLNAKIFPMPLIKVLKKPLP